MSETPSSRTSDRPSESFQPSESGKPKTEAADKTFRERTLSAGENPLEHIDRLVRRTSPRMWLGVVAFAAFVSAAVIWAAVAQRTVTVPSQAVLIPSTGLFTTGELVQGVVSEIFINEGDSVRAGQKLASVATAQGTVEVTSPIDGEVVVVHSRRGQVHAAGEPIVVVAPAGEHLAAIALLSPGAFSSIAVGQDAAVAVNGVATDRYGRIRGKVSWIDPIPVSRSRLRQLTSDATLAASIGQQGPVYEVVVELERANTPSGLRWTEGQGPAAPVPIGALGIASVTVAHQSLIVKAFR